MPNLASHFKLPDCYRVTYLFASIRNTHEGNPISCRNLTMHVTLSNIRTIFRYFWTLQLFYFSDGYQDSEKAFKSLLSNFRTCHFKFLTGIKSPKFMEYDFITTSKVMVLLENQLTISLETLDYILFDTNITNFHNRKKFSLCFIHCYMVDQQSFSSLEARMIFLEKAGEKPVHIILFEDYYKISNTSVLSRDKYFCEFLPSRLSIGLVIGVISHSLIYIPCVTCLPAYQSVVHFLTNTDVKSIETLKTLWVRINGNLHGAFVNTMWDSTRIKISLLISCDGFVGRGPKYKLSFVTIPETYLCVHVVLSKKLNYTYIRKVGDTERRFAATGEIFVADINYQVQRKITVNRVEWMPYAVEYKPFYFITMLPKPGFHATRLVFPFDWYTWVLIFASGFAEFLTVYFISGCRRPMTIFTAVVGSGLDQTVSKSFRQSKILDSSIISFVWLVWYLMIFIITHAYKGTIFSFLTKGIDPMFPNSLNELVSSSYEKFTLTGASQGLKRFSLFKHQVLAYIPDWYGKNYVELNHTLNWYNETIEKLVDEVFTHNYNASYVPNRKLRLGRTDLVFLDYAQKLNTIGNLLRHFIPENVVSKPVRVPGYQLVTPWEVSLNAFYPVFVSALASYYESGIYNKLGEYVERVKDQLHFRATKMCVQTHKKESGTIENEKFQMQSDKGNLLKDAVKPISYDVISPLSLVYLVLMTIAFCGFGFEILQKFGRKTKMKRKKNRPKTVNIQVTSSFTERYIP